MLFSRCPFLCLAKRRNDCWEVTNSLAVPQENFADRCVFQLSGVTPTLAKLGNPHVIHSAVRAKRRGTCAGKLKGSGLTLLRRVSVPRKTRKKKTCRHLVSKNHKSELKLQQIPFLPAALKILEIYIDVCSFIKLIPVSSLPSYQLVCLFDISLPPNSN